MKNERLLYGMKGVILMKKVKISFDLTFYVFVLTVILLVLKLVGLADYSWFVVLAPLLAEVFMGLFGAAWKIANDKDNKVEL